MKKITTLLAILIATTTFAQNTYVPDNNFEQALIDLGYDTPPLDNFVLTANISNVTSLDISNKGIFNLIGIGGFASLEYLNCNNNQLTSLNLTNNSNLQTLRCANNTITELDMTQNTNLQTLGCRDNNLRILTLNLNTSLQSLYCQNNNLIRINVKNGNNTNFTDFFATDNPDLICIQVDDENYSTTNWTNIDLQTTFDENCNQYFTDVPDDNFEQALIDLGYDSPPLDDYVPTANISGVTSLDVSNKNIADLTGIEDFTDLEVLSCSFNQLTSLDISQNIALQELSCGSNQLTSLDVSQNSNLSFLVCYNNQLTSLDISQNIALQELSCSNNQLTSLDTSQNSNLSFLGCSDNQLTSLDVSQNIALQELSCSNNQLTSLDISQNIALQKLSCSNNQLTSLDVKNGNNINFTTFTATNNPNLTCIQVDDATWSTTNWTNIDPTASFNDVSCNSSQTYVPDDNFEQALIDLGYDSGTLDDYVPTANINSITTLDLDNKNITDLTGVEDFSALEVLSCSFNQLTNLDISNNINLTNLRCNSNQLTSLDVSNNTDLIILWCDSNQLTSLDVSNNTSLEDLSCGNNQLTSLDVSTNTTLLTLWCYSNQLTGLDISNNMSLENLFCEDNQISLLNLSQNPNLNSLKCNDNQLVGLNIQNGNNTAITNNNFVAINNPNLTCIEVDDAAYSTANWTNIDSQSYFNENCTQQTYVPDDNFENYLENNGMGNGVPNDDLVITANINGVITLNVSGLNIADLTGIQFFTALQNLNVNDNVLTALDLTQNQNLQNVFCQDNSIELLNLSQNPNLVNLRCQSNQLTGLNVKNGNNTAITNDNFITTNNPNLTCILVDDATWSTANWANIDPTSTFVNNQAECTALSIANNTFETQLNLYPNPVKNTFTIQNNSNYNIDTINIYTILGKLVLTTNNTTTPIDISNLLNGMYLVKINSNDKTAIKKIIINK